MTCCHVRCCECRGKKQPCKRKQISCWHIFTLLRYMLVLWRMCQAACICMRYFHCNENVWYCHCPDKVHFSCFLCLKATCFVFSFGMGTHSLAQTMVPTISVSFRVGSLQCLFSVLHFTSAETFQRQRKRR